MNNFNLIIISAIIIEVLIEGLKGVAVREMPTPTLRGISITLGIIFAINFNLDILQMFDLSGRISAVGIISTGMLIGSGSGLIYDTIKRIKMSLKEENKGE